MGQVTVFIIIAILIIAIAVSIFYFRDSFWKESVSTEISPIVNFIQECLEEKTKEGIYSISSNGGYYEIPEDNKFSIYGQDYASYYDRNVIYPELEVIEDSLSEYILINLESCLNFEVFEKQDFEISYSDYSISTRVDSEINSRIEGFFSIKKGDSVSQFNEFSIVFESDFLNLIETSRELVLNYSNYPNLICLSCIDDISGNNDVSISSNMFFIPGFENQIIFFSLDSSEKIFEDKILNLNFVVKNEI